MDPKSKEQVATQPSAKEAGRTEPIPMLNKELSESEAKKRIAELTDSQEKELESSLISGQTLNAINQVNSEAEVVLTGPVFSLRGYETFEYEAIHKRYKESIPVIRDFELPLCKSKMKANALMWMMTSPFLSFFLHGFSEMSTSIFHIGRVGEKATWRDMMNNPRNMFKKYIIFTTCAISLTTTYYYYFDPAW